MRLPCRVQTDQDVHAICVTPFVFIGCLSFEERCVAAPLRYWNHHGTHGTFHLLELEDAPDGVPDYRIARSKKVETNRSKLANAGLEWTPHKSTVMANVDTLLQHLDHFTRGTPPTVILDITSLPKRYFCFFVRKLLEMVPLDNLIVTYTHAGAEGYTEEDHLAADVMSPDTFPGFAGKLHQGQMDLVVAVGFEALGLRSLILSLQREIHLRIILPFPAPIETVRRQWETLREIMENDPGNLRSANVAVIAAWDTEFVYNILDNWGTDTNLILAPFGPKTHTLAMALFAIKQDASLWYTQPKVYHPDYTRGIGETWWYIVKWRGIACFDR